MSEIAPALAIAPPALQIEGVSWAYTRAKPTLDAVSLEVPRGSFTALLGPNGAGKTTLMALVTRLFLARTGSIRVMGHDLARDPRAALALTGVVFQRPTLDLDLDIRQNLRYAARLYGLGPARAATRTADCLERLGIAHLATAPVRSLSGGMRRRVELARALLHEPSLLVLDEPTVGLDIDSRRAIVGHVHDLCAKDGLAAFWTTHLVDEIRPLDRVVVLHQGRVRARGEVGALLAEHGAADLAGLYRRLTTPPENPPAQSAGAAGSTSPSRSQAR